MRRPLMLAAVVLLGLLCGFVTPASAQTIEECDYPDDPFGTATVPTLTRTVSVSEDEPIVDVEVWLDITHTWIADVTVTLESPAGTELLIFSTSAFSADANLIISQSGVPLGDSLYTCECYQQPPPGSSMAVFAGESTQGTWSLTVDDVYLPADSGTLKNWCLYLYHYRDPLEEVCSSPALAIADGGGTVSDVVTMEEEWLVSEVEFAVDISHSSIDDLSISVTSPQGTQLTLLAEAAPDGSAIRVTFSNVGSPGLGGSYDCNCLRRPQGASDYDFFADHARGDWTISVFDVYDGDEGTLNEWCVRVFGYPLYHLDHSSYPHAYYGGGTTYPDAVTDILTIASDDDEKVEDLGVYLSLSHSGGIEDLKVMLESPAGTQLTLHDGEPGGLSIVGKFASIGLPQGSVPYVSSFTSTFYMLPSGPGAFEDFRGESISGDWALTCSDKDTSDAVGGYFELWKLQFARKADRVLNSVPETSFIDYDGSPQVVAGIEVDDDRPVKDIDVLVNIAHPWIGELKVLVSSPAATTVTLHGFYTSDARSNMKVVWSDLGYDFSESLPFASNYSAFYEPEGPGRLSDFAGEDANGEWDLSLWDDYQFGDFGTLHHWGMRMFLEASPLFRRGDVNGNGTTSGIQDTIYLLQWAFVGGPAPPCMDAADIDGNGSVNGISDALKLLGWSFLGGAEPPDPGPAECGPDNNVDALSCDTPPACD